MGDLGVAPVFFDEIAYDSLRRAYVPVDEAEKPESISGSTVRQAISDNELLPEWFMREAIQNYLRSEVAAGHSIVSN